MPRRNLAPCTEPGCPELTRNNKCTTHQPADNRPTSSERGYDADWRRDRKRYLTAFPICALCGRPSQVPDHWPTSRVELIAAGVTDPDAWHRLRPLCTPCHNSETAVHQPGGWNRRVG